MIVKNFKHKKLVDYLNPGMSVCIKFYHGLGDTIMFYPVFEYLQQSYPDVKMTLWTSIGQEEYFGKVSCKEEDYDIVFELKFPCCEFDESTTKYTKAEYCCIKELGIDYSNIKENSVKLKNIKSPLVAVHFQGTSCPDSTNPNYDFCKKIYDKIIENRLIPVEVMFEHQYHNPKNKKFDFIGCSVRKCQPSINNLIGLMQRCCGFVGVNSGPFHLAMNIFPSNVLYLEKDIPYKVYYPNKEIFSINTNSCFNDDIFNEWLKTIKR